MGLLHCIMQPTSWHSFFLLTRLDSLALCSTILLASWQWQNDFSHVGHDMSWNYPWDLKNCARHIHPMLQKFTPQEIMNFSKGFLPSAASPKSPWTSFLLSLVYPKMTHETVGTVVQKQFGIRWACSKKNLWRCVPSQSSNGAKNTNAIFQYYQAAKKHIDNPNIKKDLVSWKNLNN